MDDMLRTSPLVFDSPSTTLVYKAVSNEGHSFPLLFVSLSCIVVCCLILELTSFLPFSVLSFHSQPKTGAATQQKQTDDTTNKTKEDTIYNDGEQQNKEAQSKDKSNGAEAVSNEVHSFPLYFSSVSFHVTHHRPMLSYLTLEVK